MSEATTDKPNKPALWALGCLLGFWCGVAGVMLGQYWGGHFRLQQQLQIRMQTSDILRAKGRIVDANDISQPFALVGKFWGGCIGWTFGWLLTAFIPRGRTRTARDYLLIGLVGLLPLCTLVAPIVYRHLLRTPAPSALTWCHSFSWGMESGTAKEETAPGMERLFEGRQESVPSSAGEGARLEWPGGKSEGTA